MGGGRLGEWKRRGGRWKTKNLGGRNEPRPTTARQQRGEVWYGEKERGDRRNRRTEDGCEQSPKIQTQDAERSHSGSQPRQNGGGR